MTPSEVVEGSGYEVFIWIAPVAAKQIRLSQLSCLERHLQAATTQFNNDSRLLEEFAISTNADAEIHIWLKLLPTVFARHLAEDMQEVQTVIANRLHLNSSISALPANEFAKFAKIVA